MADTNDLIATRLGLPELPVVEFPDYDEPEYGLHWTTAIVVRWATERTGVHPAVAVWTADQLAEFLGSVNHARCSPSGGWPACAGCAGVSCAGCGGVTSTSTAAWSRSSGTGPRSATTSSRVIPRPRPGRRAVALDKRSVQILRVHRRYEQARKEEAADTGNRGPTPGTCSPDPTGCQSTRTTPPPASDSSPAAPGYRRSGCTTCGTRGVAGA
jgi:hypothetical protein